MSICLFQGAASAAQYTAADLGPGIAYDINNAGTFVAVINGQPVFGNGAGQEVITPPPPGGPPLSWYTVDRMAINDVGDFFLIYGTYSMVIHDGAYSSLTYLPNVFTAMNNSRNVCGYQLHQGDPGITGFGPSGYLDDQTVPRDINDQNVMVGAGSTNYSEGVFGRRFYYSGRACIITNQTPYFLDTRPSPPFSSGEPDHDLSRANAINNGGQVVGYTRSVLDGPKRAFLYVGAGLQDLGTFGGTNSEAMAISGNGVVVGWSETSNAVLHAFIYQNGTMTDLNDLLPAGTGWTLQTARSVNDVGQIVGDGLLQGVQHAFLLSPAGLGIPPTITSQPTGGQASMGGSFSFSVSARGDTPLSFQWQKTATNIPGATAAALTLTDLTAFDSGAYRVVVSNASGQVISWEANLTVLDPELALAAYAGIKVTGQIGASYRIDYSTNAPATWLPLTTLLLTNQSQLFIDMETPMNPMRVYRAVRLP